MPVEYLPGGDTALTVQFGYEIERALSLRVMRVKAAVEKARIPGVVDMVTSYRSFTVHYNPMVTGHEDLVSAIGPLLEGAPDLETTGITWTMPVCYEGEDFAPDLEFVAEQAGMTPQEVVQAHASVTHYNYMIGFQPGQPHLGDLPPRMNLLRRQEPRVHVAKGSILTAIGLSVVYPNENASGWHIIGRTPLDIFDCRWERPALFAPGDQVVCQVIGRDEYKDIRARIDAGDYEVQSEGQAA